MMKRTALFFILLLPISAIAGGGINQEQIQKMMQQALGLQACMQNIDQTEMQAYEQRARQMEAETKALCANGKRDEAVKKAMSFGKEASNSKAMQELMKCGEGMKDMLPKVVTAGQDNGAGKKPRHLCDEL
ncbi:MAG: hypothetical protein ACNA7G_11510 [Methylobacter sp.]